MTHKFPTASALLPCRVARVHLCAPAPHGTADSFAAAPDAQASGTNAMGIGWDHLRCRAFLAGGDP